MPTGGFVGYTPVTRGSTTVPANSIFLTPLVAQQNGSAVALLLDTPSATVSTTFKALIYDSAHSVLLASSAQVTALAAVYNRIPFTAPLSLVAGTTYYAGFVCSTSLPVSIQSGAGPGVWFVSGGQSVASPANPLVGGSSGGNSLTLALELDGASSSGIGYSNDQAAGVTLSVSNTVATCSAAARQGARGIATRIPGAASGKYYAEVLVGGTINNGVGIGVAFAAWGVTQGCAGARYGITWLYPTGTLQTQTTTIALGLTYVAGDVIGICRDDTAHLMWFNKNGGLWYGASSTAGNPVTGTGGVTTSTSLWPLSVAASTDATGVAAVFTLRDTAGAFQYTPPAGYSAWSAASGIGVRRQVMMVG